MKSRAWLLAPIVFLLISVALAAGASAHAYYVSSSPASNAILPSAPSSVTVTLSESIKPGTASIHVTNVSSGARVDNGTATISSSDPAKMSVRLLPLGPGCWVVAWSATDAIDGHFTFGQFYFEVQNDDSIQDCLPTTGPSAGHAPVSLTEIALRFGMFLGLAIAFGASVLAALVWVPAVLEGDVIADMNRGGLRALFLWGRIGAVAFTMTVAGLWALQWTTASGSSLLDFVGSPFLASLVVRLALGFGLVATFAFLLGGSRLDEIDERSPALWVPVALCLAAIGAEAFATHAAASTAWAPWSTFADAGHLVGVAFWVGGLIVLVRLRAWFLQEENVPFSYQTMRRFSRLAAYAVGLVLVAGTALAVFLVGSFDALVGTAYGWIVLAKVSLFTPMLATGAFNRYRHVPAAANEASGRGAIRNLTRNVRLEATVGAVVFALAAILTTFVPPAQPGGLENTYVLHATSGDVRFDFYVSPTPAFPGNYTYSVELWNVTNGSPVACNCTGNLTFTNLATSVSQKVPLTGPHGNHYVVNSDAIQSAATWKILVEITFAGTSTDSATFYLQIRSPTR